MRVWPVAIPDRSYRRSILKPNSPATYYPSPDEEEFYADRRNELPESRFVDVNKRPLLRPYTSPGIYRVPTPYLSHSQDIEDRPNTVQPSYVFGDTDIIERGSPLTFVPELKSWVSNANTDYERSAAYKVSQTMYRGVTPMKRSRSVSPMRTRPYLGRSVTDVDGFGYPSMAYSTWNPYSGNHGHTLGMTRHIQTMDPLVNYSMYPQTSRESRPTTRHLRRRSLNNGYVHDLSCFQSTQPMVTGHFVIHPDWVSERMTPRRKKTQMSQLQY